MNTPITPSDEEWDRICPLLIATAVMMAIILTALICLVSCTVSFNNIRTSGQASDVVDEDMKATASPDVTIPAKLI